MLNKKIVIFCFGNKIKVKEKRKNYNDFVKLKYKFLKIN